MEIKKIPDAELEIMQVLWRNPDPLTTSEICEELHKTTPSLLATTTKLLSRLYDRGFVLSVKKGNYRIHTPLVNEEEYLEVINRTFLEKVNHNSIKKFLVSLARTRDINEEDIESLREFIKETEEKKPKNYNI